MKKEKKMIREKKELSFSVMLCCKQLTKCEETSCGKGAIQKLAAGVTASSTGP
jgi:hypothetical protein